MVALICQIPKELPILPCPMMKKHRMLWCVCIFSVHAPRFRSTSAGTSFMAFFSSSGFLGVKLIIIFRTTKTFCYNLIENYFIHKVLYPVDLFDDPMPSFNEDAFFIILENKILPLCYLSVYFTYWNSIHLFVTIFLTISIDFPQWFHQ